jgi:manganese transport protein
MDEKMNNLFKLDKSTDIQGSESEDKELSYRNTKSTKKWSFLKFVGPAFLVSVGYMDPGNWATDIDGGARFGYSLLWVILVSNMIAILLQTLSAKLGIATGKDLARLCRDKYSKPVSLGLWFTAELAMIATDFAEFMGSAIAIKLLFHITLLEATLLTGLDVILLLALQRYGFRWVETAIILFVATIMFSYVIELFYSRPEWSQIPHGLFYPGVNSGSILVAIGILGATVMPHNLYLHSSIIQSRFLFNEDNIVIKKKVMRFAMLDNVWALNMAFLVNAAILIMSASAFGSRNMHVAEIEHAHLTLQTLFGSASATIFAVALLASGLSSSTTGTMAGQIVMEGFLDIRVRPWLRRIVLRILVIAPAILAIAAGIDPLRMLVISQVLLSFQLPFAIVPLLRFTSDRELMGQFANRRYVSVLGIICAAVIICLNIYLIYATLF